MLTGSLVIYPAEALFTQSDSNTLPELTMEQKCQRLQFNFNALIVVYINFAKEKGATVEKIGEYIGLTFTSSWGNSLTPAGFVRGMNIN